MVMHRFVWSGNGVVSFSDVMYSNGFVLCCIVIAWYCVVMYSNGIVKSRTVCKVFKLLCKEE